LASPALQRLLPFLSWWPRVDRQTLRADAVAGLIGAVVVLPQGVAFATLAGLPPAYGLYCAMVPTLVAALYGSSMHAVSGPTNAVSLLVLAVLAPLAEPGSARYLSMALTLSLMSGALILAMGLFRLGALVNFVSNGVIVGFTAAIGLLIIVSQIPPLLGMRVDRSIAFLDMLRNLITHLNEWHPWALATGAVTVVTALLVRRYAPRRVPMLVATVVGSVFALAIEHVVGADASGIASLGPLPGALPPLSMPDLSGGTLRTLSGPAIAVTILSVTQAIAIVRAVAIRSGQRIDASRELIGQGLSNVAGAFFSSYPSTASVNRCTINFESGARTPLAAVLSVVALVLMLVVLAPVAALLPLPTIAGLLVVAGWGLIDFDQIRLYLRTSRQEAGVVAATLLATLFIPLEYAILIGVGASFVVYLSRTSRPAMRSLAPDSRLSERKFMPLTPELAECPQLKVLSIEGSIYFGAVDHVEAHLEILRELARDQKHLLLVTRNVNFVDVAGAELLVREARRRRWDHGRLYIQGARAPVEGVLRNGGFLEELGEENFFRSKRDAIPAIVGRLDPAICARCTARIFHECANQPKPPEDDTRTRK
jgi:sulfate permease, SulP family